MADPAKKLATYADLAAVPPHLVAEIINGTLVTSPRPAAAHARAASRVGIEIGGPFDRGKGGPGGWVILFEPELHLDGDVLVPDVAGWRRERMPEIPQVPTFSVAPNWVCEVLSPGTAATDRTDKLPIYAKAKVSHAWYIDPLARTFEVFRLDGGTFRLVLTSRDNTTIRAEPFEVIEFELGALWER